MSELRIISNYSAPTENMINGLAKIVVSMAHILDNPEEHGRFEEWKQNKGVTRND